MALSPSFPITLDKQRNIRFETMSLIRAEKEVGVKLPKAIAAGEFGFGEIVALLYAGLRHEDQAITVEQCAEFVDIYGIGFFGDLVNAFVAHMDRNPQKAATEKTVE